jgi:hypothetical protein
MTGHTSIVIRSRHRRLAAALAEFSDIDGRAPKPINPNRTIRHETASFGNFSEIRYGRQLALGCKLHDEPTVRKVKTTGDNE